ncbi:cytochrome c oxidase subunit 3 [Halobacillus halophilus]|uniref:cytochrome c oxidase subunit 3 n=1 Tax=Halobacillus halophilus TaxID=1570 RepID=UPI001CD801CF|nr:cytochrome c oxidase subunit 3 [Halobacillus halophilus]MCA1010955.1 cytochrome c oxidase subunit 3 [Halobacillus halophilus]
MKQVSEILYQDKKLGFFIYLIVEAVMFATLFATYIIFTPPSEGVQPDEVYELKTVILTSVFLLSSSGTLLVAESGLKHWNRMKIWLGLGLTLLLGSLFMGFEVHEFYKYASEGHTITVNNFLSSFYVLVGLHASHVAFGLAWMILLMLQFKQQKIPESLFIEKHKIFNYYWHFVDAIWVMIILIVYAPYLF